MGRFLKKIGCVFISISCIIFLFSLLLSEYRGCYYGLAFIISGIFGFYIPGAIIDYLQDISESNKKINDNLILLIKNLNPTNPSDDNSNNEYSSSEDVINSKESKQSTDNITHIEILGHKIK